MLLIRLLTLVVCLFCHPAIAQPITETLSSKYANTSFEYQVILPEEYKTNNQDYPMLLVLDGQNYGELVSQNVMYLADAGDIPAHVIVSLKVIDRLKHYTPTDSVHWVGDGGAPDFYQFVEKELMTRLDRDYRLTDTKILWGHSAAGLYTMFAFLRGDSQFNGFLVNDAPLDWDNNYVNKSLEETLAKPRPMKTFLYLNHSFLDPNAPEEFRYIEPILSTLSRNQDEQLTIKYHAMMEESHMTIPLLGSIDGLRAFYQGYRIPEQVIFSGLDAVKSYVAQHKTSIGARNTIPLEVLEQTGLVTLFSNPKASIEAFQYAISQYPESINLYEFLADAYVNFGDKVQAENILSKGIGLAEKLDKERVKVLIKKLNQMKQ